MHILLTDLLACPRCGPGFGLVLLADRLSERRVVRGRVGCANCRETYAIENGVLRFTAAAAGAARAGPAGAVRPGTAGTADAAPAGAVRAGTADAVPAGHSAERVAALLGLAGVAGFVLLAGDATGCADELGTLIPESEIIALDRTPGPGWPTGGGPAAEPPTMSMVLAGDRLPFATGCITGAALLGSYAEPWVEEAARTLAATRRLFIDPASDHTEQRVRATGMRVLAREGSALLAIRTATTGP